MNVNNLSINNFDVDYETKRCNRAKLDTGFHCNYKCEFCYYIDRLDVRPDKGIVKVRANNKWEIQIDTFTGQVMQVAYRRSDLIEQLHDGSWFHDKIKLWIFLPSGIILFGLWITGVYMLIVPYYIKWKRRSR